MKPIYAERIREVRQKAGLTQTEFAEIIGTTKNQLSKYETNTQDTPTKIIVEVCTNFNVDANWLMGVTVEAIEPETSLLQKIGLKRKREKLPCETVEVRIIEK